MSHRERCRRENQIAPTVLGLAIDRNTFNVKGMTCIHSTAKKIAIDVVFILDAVRKLISKWICFDAFTVASEATDEAENKVRNCSTNECTMEVGSMPLEI